MNKPTQQWLAACAFAAIEDSNEPVTWRDLRAVAVKAGFDPEGNWLFFRGALQGLMNAGQIVRTESIFVESYELPKGEA